MSKKDCDGCNKPCLVKSNETELESPENFNTKHTLDNTEIRNFFNTCPQKYEYLPETPCKHGKVERNEEGKLVKEASCEWYIESERDNYCFWSFIKRKSDPEGNMRPMLQSEIAEKFGCSPTKIHFIIKDAMKKLKDNGYLEYLRQLSDNIPNEDEMEDFEV